MLNQDHFFVLPGVICMGIGTRLIGSKRFVQFYLPGLEAY